MPVFRLIRRVARLSRGEAGLLAEAVLCLTVARVATVLLPFRRLAMLMSAARPPHPFDPEERAAMIRSVAQATGRAARHMPFRAVCLQQAIAAQYMLRRRGIETSVQFGARFAGEELQAHAWVADAGTIVIGETPALYGALAAFPPVKSE
ncbi:MAG: lasso peptide biosynthesis B2 protein [Stellaceae bacterium]